MTAITIADRSTQIWGDDALGPESFAPIEHRGEATAVTEDQLFIDALTPEAKHQMEIELALVDNWVAFKVAPTFVAQIYRGEELTVDMIHARDNLVLPEYANQMRLANEASIDISGRQTETLEARKKGAENDAARALQEIEDAQYTIDHGYLSPKLTLDIVSARKRARNRQVDANDLATDIDKFHLLADAKKGVGHTISQLLNNPNQDVIDTKSDEITVAAKKIAISQVILYYKADIATLDPSKPKNIDTINDYLMKIDLLEAELDAYGHVDSFVDTEPTKQALETAAEPTKTREIPTVEAQRERRSFRSFLLGSLGARQLIKSVAHK